MTEPNAASREARARALAARFQERAKCVAFNQLGYYGPSDASMATEAAELLSEFADEAASQPREVDKRCGFSAGGILDAPKSGAWMAACERLALQYDRWNLVAQAAQIRAGHPGWLIEHACVQALAAALDTAPTDQAQGGRRRTLTEQIQGRFAALAQSTPTDGGTI